jgi:hypothetical protein
MYPGRNHCCGLLISQHQLLNIGEVDDAFSEQAGFTNQARYTRSWRIEEAVVR